MTDEYTPTTDEMRVWVAMVDGAAGHRGESVARFDRWLAAHDAEVKAEAIAEGFQAGQAHESEHRATKEPEGGAS